MITLNLALCESLYLVTLLAGSYPAFSSKYVIVCSSYSALVGVLLLCAFDLERSHVAVCRYIAVLHGDCGIPSWEHGAYV